VRSGLVSREPSNDDRRVMLAVLTDAGYDLLVNAKVIDASKVNFQSTFNTKIIQSIKVLP
jgi:DNA-binding MarR family transcriptional regulator